MCTYEREIERSVEERESVCVCMREKDGEGGEDSEPKSVLIFMPSHMASERHILR